MSEYSVHILQKTKKNVTKQNYISKFQFITVNAYRTEERLIIISLQILLIMNDFFSQFYFDVFLKSITLR